MYFLIILFGLTMLYVSSTSRIEAYIRVLGIQGLLLFLMVIADYKNMHIGSLALLSFETIIVKAIVIPWFLTVVTRRHNILREVEASTAQFYSTFSASFILASGFLLSHALMRNSNSIQPLYFGISISAIITALFIIVTRKRLVTHAIGYMMLENGIFLLSLSVAKEMPLVVSLGILLDIFVAIFILGLFVSKIHSEFEDVYSDTLTDLKD